MKKVVFGLGMMAVSLGLTLVVGELLIRLVAPQPASWLAIYRSHPDLPFFAMLPDAKVHVDTGETEWTVITDDRGFRTAPSGRAPGRCTVLWLGDSFTLGHGVEYEESFVGQVAARTPGVRHVNASVAGYGPTQYRATLEYLGAEGFAFDRVVAVSYVGNDFHDTQWDKNPRVEDGILGNEGDLKSLLKRNLHLYRLLSAVYHALGGGGDGGYAEIARQLATPEAWEAGFLREAREQWARDMRGISDYAAETGRPVHFVVIPTREATQFAWAAGRREDAPPPAPETETETEADASRPMLPVEQAAAVLSELGAPWLDLTPVLSTQPAAEVFYRLDGHLTPTSNARVAEALLETIDFRCPEEARSGPAPGAAAAG